eukprot:2644051-Rhodomonas_salina.1
MPRCSTWFQIPHMLGQCRKVRLETAQAYHARVVLKSLLQLGHCYVGWLHRRVCQSAQKGIE